MLSINTNAELAYIRGLLSEEIHYMLWWTAGYKEPGTGTWKWDGKCDQDYQSLNQLKEITLTYRHHEITLTSGIMKSL